MLPFDEATTATIATARMPINAGHAALGVPGQVTQRRENGDVAVLCGDGAVLVLEEVEAGGQRGAPAEAVRSPRARLG